MRIAVPAENDPSEDRVAAVPDTVKRFKALNAEVVVQSNAGRASGFLDAAYEAAGAIIVQSAEEAIRDADVVLRVRRPSAEDLNGLKANAAVVAVMDPYGHEDAIRSIAEKGAAAFAMEFMPRITRAQVMDVLSSQANIAGYRAVVDAASEYGRAKMFIMGVGVAGLQAIATARRMGGIVTATDVRPATKEQVESLGAKFVAVENKEFKEAETSGGYAKEMSEDYQRQQAELVSGHIAKQDIVITTALIPGRPAPKLVSAKMVESMKAGSVIVDLAAERGGNCELTKPGEIYVTENGVKIVGTLNLAGKVPSTSSFLYAKNLFSFVSTFFDKDSKAFGIPWDDELVKATLLTKDGHIVHPNLVKSQAAA